MQFCTYVIIPKGVGLKTSSTIVKIILPCPDELLIKSKGKNFAEKKMEKSLILASKSTKNRKNK